MSVYIGEAIDLDFDESTGTFKRQVFLVSEIDGIIYRHFKSWFIDMSASPCDETKNFCMRVNTAIAKGQKLNLQHWTVFKGNPFPSEWDDIDFESRNCSKEAGYKYLNGAGYGN